MRGSILGIILVLVLACRVPQPILQHADGTNDGNLPPPSTEYIIVDHTTSSLTGIPVEYIQAAISSLKVHFLGQSHSGQILGGLDSLENLDSAFAFDDGYYSLPSTPGSLCVYTAQESGRDFTYYTGTANGSLSDALADAPSINVSVFIWCRDLETATAEATEDYLEAMSALELAHPGVRFVYATGNADATGAAGANRHHNNELIRNFVKQGANRVLYDFEDLDSWYYENGAWHQYTYMYNNEAVPAKHPDLLEEPGYNWSHATQASCEQKGRAFWYLMARLAGWNGL